MSFPFLGLKTILINCVASILFFYANSSARGAIDDVVKVDGDLSSRAVSNDIYELHLNAPRAKGLSCLISVRVLLIYLVSRMPP